MPSIAEEESVAPTPQRRQRSQPACAWLVSPDVEHVKGPDTWGFRLPATEAAKQQDPEILDELIRRAFEVKTESRSLSSEARTLALHYSCETRPNPYLPVQIIQGVQEAAEPFGNIVHAFVGRLSTMWHGDLFATFIYPRITEGAHGIGEADASSAPTLEDVIAQSQAIAEIPGGDYAIETLERAASFLRELRQVVAQCHSGRLPLPQIQPAEEGSVDLYWPDLSLTVLVNIPSSAREPITYSAGRKGAPQTFGGALEPRDIALRLLAVVLVGGVDEKIRD
jgi:hypothetical protein